MNQKNSITKAIEGVYPNSQITLTVDICAQNHRQPLHIEQARKAGKTWFAFFQREMRRSSGATLSYLQRGSQLVFLGYDPANGEDLATECVIRIDQATGKPTIVSVGVVESRKEAVPHINFDKSWNWSLSDEQ